MGKVDSAETAELVGAAVVGTAGTGAAGTGHKYQVRDCKSLPSQVPSTSATLWHKGHVADYQIASGSSGEEGCTMVKRYRVYMATAGN